MLVIPTSSVPSQTLSAVLNNQTCQINIYQQYSGLYIDLYVNNVLIIGGVICQNLNRIVRSEYLGFVGDLIFYDTQEDSDPNYSELGTRFNLLYLFPSELEEV